MALNIRGNRYKQHPYYEKPSKQDRKVIQRALRRRTKVANNEKNI